MNVELQEDFLFSTGARTSGEYDYIDFPALSVRADQKTRQFLIETKEPSVKGKGVDIRVAIPFAIIPSLMEAVLKSLTNDGD